MSFKTIIQKTDKRILAMLILLFFGVSYSVYRAVDALSGSEKSPEYRRSPPGAFAIPLADRIVDSNILSQGRIPDQAYIKIQSETDAILKKIVSNNLSVPDLERFNLRTGPARDFVFSLRQYQSSLTGAKVAPNIILSSSDIPNVAVGRVVSGDGFDIGFVFGYIFKENSDVELNAVNIET